MKHKIVTALFFPTVLAQMLWISGCSETEVGAVDRTQDHLARQSIAVYVTLAREAEVFEPIFATGTIRADQTTDISPIVSGLVENVFVDVGDRVEHGQALFKLRQTEIQLRVNQLTHALTLAKAELDNSRKDVNTNRGLRKRGAVSQEVLDNTLTRHEIVSAQLGIAESQLAEAKQALTDTISRAPYDGVITSRNINEGSYIRNMPGASQTALQIQKIDRVEALVSIPEKFLNRIRLGTPAKIFIDGLNRSYDSQIDIINDRVDPRSRTIEVRLGIANPDYGIKPGLFVRVELSPPGRTAMVLPRQAIQGGASPFVFVNRNGFANKVNIAINELEDEKVEVLSGLTVDAQVITGSNLAKVTSGASIQVLPDKE
jgi:RND family efflux transporter MFP subunit